MDREIQRKTWARVNAITGEVSGMVPDANLILDIGGGSGWFGIHLAKKHPNARILSVDIAPRKGNEGVEHIKASALDIPIKDSKADIVGANAILHHVPESLDGCISEVARVLGPDGLFLTREPLANNPLAKLARKMVVTDIHEEGETPLPYGIMRKTISKHLKIEKAEFFFLTSYLMPHLVSRMPNLRKLALFLIRFDKKLLVRMPKTRRYAAYVSIVARKPVS